MKQSRQPNQLINESSPYLLQHAYNPVDWHPWNRETLEKAKNEDKMILVSIGYSACHWCHVMERESFEDEEVARVMNEHFVCIKVDREERPDVDQVYMDAVQLISGRGGWPLNCFALPDGRPFWGATYFQRDQWLGILNNVVNLFHTQRKKINQQAEDIYEGISTSSFIAPDPQKDVPLKKEETDEMAHLLGNRIDPENGGFKGAPKFPMPNNFLFLLRYHAYAKNPEALDQVVLTLEKMAAGGIYDQVGGGFARYSVDERWHVPHFEKMLYDNAQLVSLYSEAFRATKNPYFEEIVQETIGFIERELTSADGGFYSALDADSEGEEGKFYTWTKEEFDEVAGVDAQTGRLFFGINKEAFWEEGKNVLVRTMDPAALAKQLSVSEDAVKKTVKQLKAKFLQKRSERIRPGLDDKQLTAWNALMITGFTDAYTAFGQSEYLNMAIRNARFLIDKMVQTNGRIFRNYKNGKSTIDGFLDDYAFLIEAFINLYECTFDEDWLMEAKKLADYTLEHFYDEKSELFFYTSDLHDDAITRKIEVTDNVIPASCSSLANGMFRLGLLFENPDYSGIAVSMVRKVREKMMTYPSAFSNWAILQLQMVYPFYTVVITGPETAQKTTQLQKHYRPGLLFSGGTEKPTIPITDNRWSADATTIYVCTGSECRMPVKTIEEALSQLE
jgi:hypothetical protein